MKINLQNFIYIPLVFFFLPAFTLNFTFWGGAYAVYPYFFLFLYISLFLIIILKPKQLINKILSIIHSTPIKIYLLYIIVSILDSLLLSIIGISTFCNTFRYIIVHYILCIFPFLIFFLFIIDKNISYRHFIEIFIKFFYIILILGIISYVGMFFHIEFINSFFDIISNIRFITLNNLGIDKVASGYEAFGLPRMDCVFEEPSFYARFLFVFLPLIYAISLSDIKIDKNIIANLIIKKSIIPLTWLNLILTQSPIYLILFSIITLIYFSKQIIELIKKYSIVILSLTSIIIISISIFIQSINLSNTFVSRIINVLISLRSFDKFIFIEPSLGTRIVNFINLFFIALQHPIMGVGFGNLSISMFNQILKSPVPLTMESITNLNNSILLNEKFVFNSNLFFGDIAQYGFIIFAVFIFYHIQLKKQLNLAKLYKLNYNECIYLKGLNWCWITLTIGYFYQFYMTLLEPLLINVLIISFIYRIKKRRIYETNNIHR